MIRQATVEDVSHERVTKRHGRIVVITRYYPRYLKRKLISDYFGALAPAKALLMEFKAKEAQLGDHDGAFAAVDYESKFELSPDGLALLETLAKASESETIYFVCHCRIGQRCHREIVMLMAKTLFGAKTQSLSHDYPVFAARI